MWVYNVPADNLLLYIYQKGRDSSGAQSNASFKFHFAVDNFALG
jgi:hypothetical protein